MSFMYRPVAGAVALGLCLAAQAQAQDAAAGERLFRQCAACHSLEEGARGVGPSLAGLNGATAGRVEGFRYSDAMTASGIVWTQETLTAFLLVPGEVVPGNAMSFRGMRREEQAADLAAYLMDATQ